MTTVAVEYAATPAHAAPSLLLVMSAARPRCPLSCLRGLPLTSTIYHCYHATLNAANDSGVLPG